MTPEHTCPMLLRRVAAGVQGGEAAAAVGLLLLLITGTAARAAAPIQPIQEPPASDTAAARLVLNIPAFRLELAIEGRVVRSFAVAVGATRWPTPTGAYVVDQITWNPRWVPPSSEWACDEKPMPPGPDNPMGRVKLRFAPYYYLHGTPLEGSIGTAGSHGCVRLRTRDVIDLARLVQGAGLGGATRPIDQWLAEPHTTRVVGLERVVPLDIVYEPVEIRGDSLLVHPDVYRRLSRSLALEVRAVLEAHGYGPDRIDDQALTAMLGQLESGTTALPLARVLRPAPAMRLLAPAVLDPAGELHLESIGSRGPGPPGHPVPARPSRLTRKPGCRSR